MYKYDPTVYFTPDGTPYLQEAGVAILSYPRVCVGNMDGFLELAGYDSADYISDTIAVEDKTRNLGGRLAKIAGQLCYLSFTKERSRSKDGARYIENILTQGHGSVLEHASYTLLLHGVSRSLTHELVRHRAGFAFSQVSQRYVETVRFVERPEFQASSVLHEKFLDRIDTTSTAYEGLKGDVHGEMPPWTLAARERRIAVNQSARVCLTNEVEAPIIVTANLRAWRHFLSLRGSQHAEPEIRALSFRIYMLLSQLEPWVFQDFSIKSLAGTDVLVSASPKV